MAFQTPCYYTFLIYLPVQNHQQRILFKTNKKEIHVELTKKKRSQYICDDHDGHKKVLLLKNDTIY